MRIILIILSSIFFMSCNDERNVTPKLVGVNHDWLDSVMKSSDTNYVKKYGTAKFANAEYYINKKDTTFCQVMKDASDSVRQIILTKNNRRSFFTEFYPNGQLIAQLTLDTFGQYNGPSKYYYQNGIIESEGEYNNGLKKGNWKNYNESGKLLTITEYNSNGQVVKTNIQK
jgi:antitoxin component YwqK of YwqJK toxin-antitoxin module